MDPDETFAPGLFGFCWLGLELDFMRIMIRISVEKNTTIETKPMRPSRSGFSETCSTVSKNSERERTG